MGVGKVMVAAEEREDGAEEQGAKAAEDVGAVHQGEPGGGFHGLGLRLPEWLRDLLAQRQQSGIVNLHGAIIIV